MSRELDIEIAEKVMGFRREKTPPDINGEFGGEDILVPPGVDHKTWNYPPKGKIGFGYHVSRLYSSDLNDAHEVEEKIKEMGLEKAYILYLSEQFYNVDGNSLFLMIHASASDRCRAALAAVEGKR